MRTVLLTDYIKNFFFIQLFRVQVHKAHMVDISSFSVTRVSVFSFLIYPITSSNKIICGLG